MCCCSRSLRAIRDSCLVALFNALPCADHTPCGRAAARARLLVVSRGCSYRALRIEIFRAKASGLLDAETRPYEVTMELMRLLWAERPNMEKLRKALRKAEAMHLASNHTLLAAKLLELEDGGVKSAAKVGSVGASRAAALGPETEAWLRRQPALPPALSELVGGHGRFPSKRRASPRSPTPQSCPSAPA